MCNSQNYLDTICWISITNPSLLPLDSQKLNNFLVLDSIFQINNVVYFSEVSPYTNDTNLKKIYEIRTSSIGNFPEVDICAPGIIY